MTSQVISIEDIRIEMLDKQINDFLMTNNFTPVNISISMRTSGQGKPVIMGTLLYHFTK